LKRGVPKETAKSAAQYRHLANCLIICRLA
jgi:hypothetical protein